jgi:hypothetical protein
LEKIKQITVFLEANQTCLHTLILSLFHHNSRLFKLITAFILADPAFILRSSFGHPSLLQYSYGIDKA